MADKTTDIEDELAQDLDEYLGEPEVETSGSELSVSEPYESEGARYARVRAEAKARASEVMAANAKAAEAAKRKRLRGAPAIPGQAEFLKKAAEIEKRINAAPDTKEG